MNESVELQEVAKVIMGTAPPGASYNTDGDGVPLVAGAGDYGDITPEPKKWTTSPTRVTEPGDLIVCVRATIGDLNWADREYCLGRGVAALRPKNGKLDSRYLGHFINARKRQLSGLGTGSTFLAIRRSDIETFPIPLPKLEEQKRIAAILDKADAIRRQRQEALDASTHLIEVAFHHLFGDCLANEHQFPECEFQELCGRIVDCPHSTPTYADRLTEFACVRSSDIQDGYIDWISTKYVEKDEYEVRVARHTPIAGEVLYTREGGRMGNAARVPENAKVCLGQRIMLFSAKEVETTNEFIWALLNSPGVKHQVKSLTAGAAAPRINISDIRKLKAFRPPFDLQQQFTSAVARIEQLREKQIAAHEDETHLFNSLVQRAFKGEL